jgi:hypothetical protein
LATLPALADKPASKGSPTKAAGTPGKAAVAERGPSNAARHAAKGADERGRASGEEGREAPGRPGTSEEVPGKAKGLDKEPRGKALGHQKEHGPTADEDPAVGTDERKRAARKKARVEALHQHWGSLLTRPNVLAEQKVHARRMAWLDRMREIATGDETTLARLDKLTAKEEARHARHMTELSEKEPGARGAAIENAARGNPSPRGPAKANARELPARANATELQK